MMPKDSYKNYLLIILTIVAVFNFLDRYVLAMLLEPIKQDLQLSDSQLGLLTGFAFALFYAIAGIPIARWADHGNRNIVVSFTAALWSTMLILCGLVWNFTQLLAVRVGVAVGEAGCLPAGHSLIADYFNQSERPRAMATYWLCSPIATIIGFLGSGWLLGLIGWRMIFIGLGITGVLVAILAKLTIREPRLIKAKTQISVDQPSLSFVLCTLWQQHTFRYLLIAFCMTYFFNMGIFQWMPTFFIRSHSMPTQELGVWLAFTWGICSLFGTYLGGILASRYAPEREDLQMRAMACIFLLYGPCSIMVYLVSNTKHAIVFMAIIGFIGSLVNGPLFAAIQSLVNGRMRSVAMALLFLFANLIGFGLGPLTVGVFSDLMAQKFGQDSLRYALILLSPGYFLVALFLWKAASTIKGDIIQIQLGEDLTRREFESRHAKTAKSNHNHC